MLKLQSNKSVFKYVILVLAVVKFQTARADALGETVNGLTSSLTSGLTNGLFSGLRNTLTPSSGTPRTRQYGAGMDPNNQQSDPYNQMGPQMGYPGMNMYGSQMMGGPYGQMGQMGAFGMGPGGQPHMWHQQMPMPPPYGMPPPPPPPPYGMMNPYQQQYQPYQQMQQPMNQNNPYMMSPYRQQQQYGQNQQPRDQQQYGQLPNNEGTNNNQQPRDQRPLNTPSYPVDDQPMFARPVAADRG